MLIVTDFHQYGFIVKKKKKPVSFKSVLDKAVKILKICQPLGICLFNILCDKWKVLIKCFCYMLRYESHSVVSNCDPMDHTVHGILQARILEWVAFPFPRGSSQPRDQT